MSEDLAQLRGRIDALDGEIVRLLNQRADISLAIGKAKEAAAGSGSASQVYAPGREAEVLANVVRQSAGALPADGLRAIYNEIISSSRTLQAPLRVAFLGPEATFSHQAALA